MFAAITIKAVQETLGCWRDLYRIGKNSDSPSQQSAMDLPSPYHKPWYSSIFKNIEAVADYWRDHYRQLRKTSTLFRNAFYKSTLPPEVTEAVAANLTILKSPTVLRQYDGRLGSVTKVGWYYAPGQKGVNSLPFGYSGEVWTGIEYQVVSHLILHGHLKEGLNIVRTCRQRYDGRVRNPFDEYECGHWYARAMASYALIESLTGVRYDAVEQTLYIQSTVGAFTSFLSTDTGFGNVVYKKGKASVQVVYGSIPIAYIRILP